MKRTLHLLILTLMMVSTIDAATAKKKTKHPKKTPAVVEQEVTAEAGPAIAAPPVKREKKTADDGDPVSTPPGPGPFGPPIELSMKRASGRKFDLRSLPQAPPVRFERPEHEDPEITPRVFGLGVDQPPVTQGPSIPTRNAPAPPTIMNFDGLDFATWGAGHPPDTNGDVGPTYYIQTINTSIGIFRKSDGVRVAAFTFNTFMSQGAFGNLCDTNNFGDPVVVYDSFEDRWIITDFAFQLDGGGNVVNPPGNFQCVAASMTGDPVSGGWNFYSINTAGGLGDYPKFGIWPDALYMSVNMFGYPSGGAFQNPRVYAFNKAQMYAGKPSVQVVTFNAPAADFTVIPSNARLQAGTPPAGTPNYYVSTEEFLNALTVYKFHVNWNSISLSTFTGPDTPLAATSWPASTPPNAPSLGGNALDVLAIRNMVQNQYTNLGGVESLWDSHTVRRGDTAGFAAPRWYQVNVTGGTVNPAIPQAATWDPDGANVIYRFTPSVAVDRAGNLAMGYSTSNATTKPAIKYAGRLATDPINTFGQTESLLFQGTGTQLGNCGASACIRWGDYSAMTLDPDGCTFWMTNEYYAVDGLAFLTRIGSFAFPSCTPVGAGGTITGTVTATTGGAPINGVTVSLGARSTTTNPSGVYTFSSIPAGTYPTLTATFPGYNTATASNIVVTDGGTTTQNFSLDSAPTSTCLTDTTQADFQTGILTSVDVTTSPGDVLLFKPSIDQQNPTLSNSGVGITITTFGGQTFTPAVTGLLTRVDLNLFCSGCTGTTPNLTLSIRATSAGLPTGADLVAGTITGFSNGGVASYFSVIFGSPITLTAGTMYAIVIRPVTNPAPGTYALTRSANDVYAGGTRVSGATSGTVWSIPLTAGASTDAGFITYMDSGFGPSGNLVSSTKDSNPLAGLTPIWSTLSWTAMTPANTAVSFQIAGSNSTSGPFNFVGPDGTGSTFFTTSGASLAQFYNLRYLQYKAYLSTTNSAVSPTLNDVSLCLNNTDCSAPITITPTPAQVCANSLGNTASGPAGAASYSWGITNGTITGGGSSQTVTYTAGASGSVGLTLNIVDGSGCQKSASTSVTINPIPATPTITPGGPTTFCAGGSVTLTSSSASGNQWYLTGNPIGGATNQTFMATASGNYTVTVTTAGCTSSPSSITTVTVNPIPPTPTITPGGPTTFCAGGSVTLTSSSASGNQWYLNGNPIGGATNQTYVATSAGDYTVTVTTTGCTSAPSTTTTVTVNPNPNATITAPANATSGTTNNHASVANAGVGATYSWGISGGTITAGAGTASITFTAGAPGTLTLNVTVNTGAGCSDAKSANVTVGSSTVTVTSVSPNHGTATGDTLATINGTGFAAGATVTFGGTAATSVNVVSSIKITARTPAHANGSVNVTVTNPDTTNGTLTAGYLYQTQSFDPNNDNTITSADIFFLVNYLFMGGPAPHGASGVLSGDANGDGLVDSADIFYVVNYLFLGGQKPNGPNGPTSALTPRTLATKGPQIGGSITLGKAVLRDGHYIVPVIMTANGGSIVPQSMALRVHFDAEGTLGELSVRRAGAATDAGVAFEINRRMGNDLTYLVTYDPRNGGLTLGASRSAVVAEIEVDTDANVSLSIDPLMTMLSDQAGTVTATVANRKLEVKGTAIGSGASPHPRTPDHGVN